MATSQFHNAQHGPEAPISECMASGGRECVAPALGRSAAAFLAWRVCERMGRCVVIITESLAALEELYPAIEAFKPENAPQPLFYPLYDAVSGARVESSAARMAALSALACEPRPVVMAACVQAVMQHAPSPETIAGATFQIRTGAGFEMEKLALRLEELGFEFTPEIEAPAQASRRGGILDLWPASEKMPARLEFLGNQIESIRLFDPLTQLSVGRVETLTAGPVDEQRFKAETRTVLPAHFSGRATLWLWLMDKPFAADDKSAGRGASDLEAHARAFFDTASGAGAADGLRDLAAVRAEISRSTDAWRVFARAAAAGPGEPYADPGFRAPCPAFEYPRTGALDPESVERARRAFVGNLAAAAEAGTVVRIFFGTAGALSRFEETHKGCPMELRLGNLPDGFFHPGLNMAAISETDLRGGRGRKIALPAAAKKHGRRALQARAGETITDWTGIEPGDMVVHAEHGIGRYLGLRKVEFNGEKRESLALEYADKVKLFVPVTQAHLVSRYVGIGGRGADPHRLGGARWDREKDAAEKAVFDLAASLIETQAMREAMPGHAFAPDAHWQFEFEQSFPYEETDDQERALAEVKRDMESPKSMDRLVCGDAGYGKTEVAMRAAFKAVMDGRQVAVLAPTTVLAQQHYELFAERMAMYPVRVELLCRLRPRSEQVEIARAIGAGSVDIAVGTHRLLASDVAFKNLGLAIIDEEQRFGVAHKEWLKRHNTLIDALSLSATPIPRTLYMSLTGVKDISMVQTPPKARQPVETVLAETGDETIRSAIARELNRGGQVYYLHNRVMTIEKARERLLRIVPNARIAVAHGRMPVSELASVMGRFEAREFDVLLCTTIIESGLDMPNVNTIVIDRADRFGMADLYQLRGRVGRSSRKAYAYLMLPPGAELLAAARRRLRAIQEHSDLGVGFKLAMHDLEIRGAGNLLGPEQSGHIAAIGFDFYCRLLRMAVDSLAAEKAGRPLPAGPPRLIDVEVSLDFLGAGAGEDPFAILPEEYVEDERTRLALYRKIASALSPDDIVALRRELRDRFGPPPAAAGRLLKIADARVRAAAAGIGFVEVKDRRVMCRRNADFLTTNGRFPRLKANDPDGMLDELLRLLDTLRM